MDLKVFITFFQKMILLIGIRATVHEVLTVEIAKTMLTQQKFDKAILLQTLIYPNQ